jgi:predicted NBD/HSP70 family sugar kinase
MPGTTSVPRLISHAATGRLNRTRMLQILYDAGPLSRAELARIAGVAKTTIGSIVQPMLDQGILVEGEPQPSSAQGGKPARPIWFSATGRPLAAVHLGPGTVQAALVNPTGAVLSTAKGTFSGARSSPDSIVARVAETIEEVLPASDGRSVLGLGVGVGGIVNTDEGRIVEVNLAPRLSGLALGPELAQRFGVPVYLDHHPRVQTLGDRWFGAGRTISSFASVSCGEAIGAGFVIDGEVHRGRAGSGGEVGHAIVDYQGAVCRCGRRGCWETIATHSWLRSEASASELPKPQKTTVASLTALAEAGEQKAAELLDRFARNVSVGIINLQQTLAPGLFILHGDVTSGGERLRQRVEGHVRNGVAHHPGGEPSVVFAGADDDIALLGAAGLVLSESLEMLA